MVEEVERTPHYFLIFSTLDKLRGGFEKEDMLFLSALKQRLPQVSPLRRLLGDDLVETGVGYVGLGDLIIFIPGTEYPYQELRSVVTKNCGLSKYGFWQFLPCELTVEFGNLTGNELLDRLWEK